MCWFWIWKPSYSIGSGLFAIPVLEVPGTFLYWAGSVVLSWDKRLLAVLSLLRYNTCVSAEIFWKFQRYWDIFLRYSIFWDVFLGCIAVNIFRAHTSIESHGTSRKKFLTFRVIEFEKVSLKVMDFGCKVELGPNTEKFPRCLLLFEYSMWNLSHLSFINFQVNFRYLQMVFKYFQMKFSCLFSFILNFKVSLKLWIYKL